MTAKQYLQQIRQLDAMIQCKTNSLRQMQEVPSLRGIDYSADRVQRSSSNNGMGAVDRMVDEQRKTQQEIKTLTCKRDRIIQQVKSMDNPIYSTILYLRYVDGMQLRDIADTMKYNYGYVRRIHGFALQSFEKILKEVTKGNKR